MDTWAPAGWGMISLALCEGAAAGLSSGRVEQCSLHGALSAEVGIGKDCSSPQQPTLWVSSVAVKSCLGFDGKDFWDPLVLFFFLQGKYWPNGSFLALSVACKCVYDSSRICGTCASGDTNDWGTGAHGAAMKLGSGAQIHVEQLQFLRWIHRHTHCGGGTSMQGVGMYGAEVQGLGEQNDHSAWEWEKDALAVMVELLSKWACNERLWSQSQVGLTGTSPGSRWA